MAIQQRGKGGKTTTKKESQLVKKPKRKARVERILKKREPQLVENTKKSIFIRGHRTSQAINDVLKDLAMLCKPHSKALQKKNEILPFEDCKSIEFLSEKNDCSLFAFGSHSKKRPNNLILGRLFDGQLLDMIEFGVNMESSDSEHSNSKGVGSKPVLIFLGDLWESDKVYSQIQNLFTDFFRGDKVDKLSLKALDHALVFTVHEGQILMRPFAIDFRKSGSRIPDVEMLPFGKHLNFSLRRTQLASDEIWKVACKMPKSSTPKIKNKTRTEKGETLGRIHLKKQNLDNMSSRRVDALRSAS